LEPKIVSERNYLEAGMKIGELVKRHIQQILSHCNTVDHGELGRLLNRQYSKQVFGINFPFCQEIRLIPPEESKRYWTSIYFVQDKQVRVTSQWYKESRSLFIQYLTSKEIISSAEANEATPFPSQADSSRLVPKSSGKSKFEATVRSSRVTNSRYRGNAISNAQNLFVRNILSNLGHESFNEHDWNTTKAYFMDRCAYCNASTSLIMDHAVPINKESLGEHRLGNLVPSCDICNSNKAGLDFRTFLADNPAAIQKIEVYMESRNYIPLEDNEQLKHILRLAHSEIAALAERYISIINELFPYDQRPGAASMDAPVTSLE
jgi:5-methylcytosine-specific restriction endonuclease McrA